MSPGRGGGLFKPIQIWPITDAILSCLLSASDVVNHSADSFETHRFSALGQHTHQCVTFVEAYGF